MTKVSVIVPVYNSEKYLKDALDSLVNKTLKDIEIIIIDDASTDNSLNIINEYAKSYHNIKVYHNNVNKGQGASRNIGIDAASGEYIGFVDSDDFIEKNMYETMYNSILENNYPEIATIGIDFIQSDAHYKGENRKVRWEGKLSEIKKNPMDLVWESPSCCNKLFKRDLIDNYRFLENTTWEDIAFTNVLLMKSNRLVRIIDNFYHYRRSISSGVSSNGYKPSSPLNDIFKVADEIGEQAKINKVYEQFKDYIKLIQIAVCYQRLEEINKWDIDEETKKNLLISFYLKVKNKYGFWRDLDIGLLSSKTNLFLLEDIEDMLKTKSK